MIDTLLSQLAPHLCCGCRFEGTLLCDNCKYDITSEPYVLCVACGTFPSDSSGICVHCQVSYSRAWCVGDRLDSLRALIEQYKFHRAKQAYQSLAAVLDETLPDLPRETIVVTVPTLASHIRQRGYDHAALIGREFARRRNLRTAAPIQRVTTTKQLGAGRKQRFEQAKHAFVCPALLSSNEPYLLIDDVVTTGATVEYAAQALLSAGATDVWVAAASRQPLI